MKSLACIKELQNVEEYYDFVQQLQSFDTFPPTEQDKDGLFIVLRLTTTGKLRKMRLGIAYTKEQLGQNLICLTLDAKNNLQRATVNGDPNKRYNFMDRESMIVGCVYLLTTRTNTKTFLLTAFPLQLDIARTILQSPHYLPTFHLGPLTPNTVTTTGESTEPNVLIRIQKYTIVGGRGRGLGSGVAITSTVSTTVNDAVPVDPNIPGSLQIPTNVTSDFLFDPVPLNTYLVFQIPAVGNQNNIVTVSLVGGQTVFNPSLPVVTTGL